jgi:serine/threonine protein kinase
MSEAVSEVDVEEVEVGAVEGLIAANEAPDALIGSCVGNYELSLVLGRGGMGTVYYGRHRVIESRVAVKVLHPRFTHNPRVVKRFFAEARAVNLIEHDNVVHIFDLSTTPDGRYYFVMEYLSGHALCQILDEGAMPWTRAAPIISQILDALAAAHDHDIVHRDLKPANVMIVVREGREVVKILDFGVAKLNSEELGPNTESGVLIGTPHYMSPEQAAGTQVDGRADLYSVGVLLYRIATGRVPFEAGSLRELLLAHMTQQPTAPSQLDPTVSPSLERVILKTLAKDPADRYQTARDLRKAFEQAIRETARPLKSPVSLSAVRTASSANPRADKLIERFAPLLAKGHYEFLQIPSNAEMSTIRQAARRIASELCLEALGPMPPEQGKKIAIVKERLLYTLGILASPKSRADYDARIANYLGVAQALAAGLKVDEASALREVLLKRTPGADKTARAHLKDAIAAERSGRFEEAREKLEQALAADPLDVTLHHRYWAIRRRLHGTRPDGPGASPRPRRIVEKQAG